MKNNIVNFFLLVLSGVLFSLAWAPYNYFIAAMIGFVPLLMVEQSLSGPEVRWRKTKVFWSAYLVFSFWNFSGIWWVSNAAWVGVIASVLVNSFFYSMIFLLFSQTKKYLGTKLGYFAFVIFWLAWEYIEIVDWDLSWPWLTLGYSLANHPWMIQWYEYSGALGGSLWILLVNLMVFKWVQSFSQNNSFFKTKRLLYVFYVFFPPVFISSIMYFTYTEKGEKATFVVVQPNIDPYTEKFTMLNGQQIDGLSSEEQVEMMLSSSKKMMDSEVDYVMFPESAIPRGYWDYEIKNAPEIQMIKTWLKDYPNANLITGTMLREEVTVDLKNIPADVHKSFNQEIYYKRYNSSVQVNKLDTLPIYNKSKLVIGVERIPSYFVFLQKYLAGFDDDANAEVFNPNNSVQENREVFTSMDGKIKVAPIVCFESIFGEYVGEYVLKGANVLGIITNDGWWGDTPGYKQHFSYARLRAIEQRKSVARSANTGMSGFINQRGDVLQQSEYWKPAVLKQSLQLNNEVSFYARFGDWIGKICVPIAVVLLINLFLRRLKKKIRQ